MRYCFNNPLIYTDPDGESFIAFAIGFVIGSYLTGVAYNKDWTPWTTRKNDDKSWAWDDPGMYITMGIGGLAGGFVATMGWGVIAENYAFNLTIGSGVGEAVQVGAQFLVSSSGITFEGLGYATVAGGGGFLTYKAIKGINNINPSPQKPYWSTTNKLHSDEAFAYYTLMDFSYYTNKELIMLALNDGAYWFEPFEGFSANHNGKYMQNTSTRSYVYTYWNTGSGGTYIQPNFLTRYYVDYLVHTHPRSYTVSKSDSDVARIRKINVFAIGYDNNIHVAEGVTGYRRQVGFRLWDILIGRASLKNFNRSKF